MGYVGVLQRLDRVALVAETGPAAAATAATAAAISAATDADADTDTDTDADTHTGTDARLRGAFGRRELYRILVPEDRKDYAA